MCCPCSFKQRFNKITFSGALASLEKKQSPGAPSFPAVGRAFRNKCECQAWNSSEEPGAAWGERGGPGSWELLSHRQGARCCHLCCLNVLLPPCLSKVSLFVLSWALPQDQTVLIPFHTHSQLPLPWPSVPSRQNLK